MNAMNDRQKAILKILLESTEYLSSRQIAYQLACSEKTVRNDSKVLDQWLSKNSNATLSRKPNIGFRLEISQSERNSLLHTLYNQQQLSDDFEEKDRLSRILELLLIEKESVTIQKLSELFFVNKAIIRKDLEKIEDLLGKYNLSLAMKKKLGIEVAGSEQNWRLAISKIPTFFESTVTNQMNFWGQIFEKQDINAVQLALENVNQQLSNPYTDETLHNLAIHILISIKRLKLGHPIQLPESEIKRVQRKKEFQLAEQTLNKLQHDFAIRFPLSEIAYITLHFMGGKVQKVVSDKMDIDHDVHTMTANLVNRVSNRTHIDFTQDDDLLLGLNVHLQSTVHRIKHGLSVTNPMLEQIKRMYPYMFHIIVNELFSLYKEMNLHIPEEEAAFLTLHFQASLERLQKRSGNNKKGIIVCPMGIGASTLLRTKLERKFHSLDIIDTESINKIHQYSSSDIDFIISTVPIPDAEVPVIEVTPLLTNEEQKKLEAFIEELGNEQKDRIRSLDGKFPNLRALMDEKLILIDLDLSHPYEIIETLIGKLAQQGHVEKEYIESAIIREKHSSTNIGGGIAIPHGDPSYIKTSAIAVGVLKKPMLWGKEYVSLVLALAIKPVEKTMTKKLFNEISKLSDHPLMVNQLIKQKTAQDFIKNL
jgi:activator of the mannose operon (transcriptional antiterminator)